MTDFGGWSARRGKLVGLGGGLTGKQHGDNWYFGGELVGRELAWGRGIVT